MKKENKNPFKEANVWTYIGTIGYFMGSFFYASEWLAQYIEITAKDLGCPTGHSKRIFGFKKIGGVPATYYAIGCSIAFIATLGLCYAVFFQLLHYQNTTPKKPHKKTLVNKILNPLAILGSTIIVTIWISGAALTIFLLPIALSVVLKNIIIYSLITFGIIACVPYVQMYSATLPGHQENQNKLEINEVILSTCASFLRPYLNKTSAQPDDYTPMVLGCIIAMPYIQRYALTSADDTNNQKTHKQTSKSVIKKIRQVMIRKKILEYTSMLIFSIVGFFCNAYFLAYLAQNYIFFSFHKLLWSNISLFAWTFGIAIGLFFTISAVYCYSTMYSEKNRPEINDISLDNNQIIYLNRFTELCGLSQFTQKNKKTPQAAKLKKILLKSALIGFCGVTILDTFFPISIALIYLFKSLQQNFIFIFIDLAAAFLSILCTVGPYQAAKTSIEEYNETKISFGLI